MRTHCPVCGRGLHPDLQPSMAFWSPGMQGRRRPPWVHADWIKSICGGCQERFSVWFRRTRVLESEYWVEDNRFNFNLWLAGQLQKDLQYLGAKQTLRLWCREVTASGPCPHQPKYDNGFCTRHEPGVYTVAHRTGRRDKVAAERDAKADVDRRQRVAERAYLRRRLICLLPQMVARVPATC